MKKKDWLPQALSSLEFFAKNPEYKREFGHSYFCTNLGISRQTLYRNKRYMARYQEVKELLKGYRSTDPSTGPAPISGDKEKIQSLRDTVEKQKQHIIELQLRLNDCYQILEDHGIDPEFVYQTRRKKFQEA